LSIIWYLVNNEKQSPMPKHYDPPMHSAEHILNQTMVRMFDCGRCIDAHVEKKKSRIDYRFDRNLTDLEIAEIERRVNEIIGQDLKVKEEFLSRFDAAQKYNLGKLPDEAGDQIRIILIGDYDACPCSGPHVNTTGEIGKFSIVSTGYENGLLRIRFKLRDN
jgi:misacylated tRNA(Ala) deacylase